MEFLFREGWDVIVFVVAPGLVAVVSVFLCVVVELFVECCKNICNGLSILLELTISIRHTRDQLLYFPCFDATDLFQITVVLQHTVDLGSSNGPLNRSEFFLYLLAEFAPGCSVVAHCLASFLDELCQSVAGGSTTLFCWGGCAHPLLLHGCLNCCLDLLAF